jgi:hypothetical protein
MSAPMPSKYVAGPFVQYSAQPGGPMLNEDPTSSMARPKIQMSAGRRKTHHRKYSHRKITRRHKHKARKSRKQKGGFIPSIGEGFAAAAAKYITPIALYGLYRFIDNKKSRKSKGRRTRRR